MERYGLLKLPFPDLKVKRRGEWFLKMKLDKILISVLVPDKINFQISLLSCCSLRSQNLDTFKAFGQNLLRWGRHLGHSCWRKARSGPRVRSRGYWSDNGPRRSRNTARSIRLPLNWQRSRSSGWGLSKGWKVILINWGDNRCSSLSWLLGRIWLI